jgi:recombination protein RecT
MENNTQIATREKESKSLVFAAEKQFSASNEYKMNFNREAGFAIQILTNNPYLMKCDPDSVKHAVVNVALTGITLNPALKYAYLVPRKVKNELKCILDISYMGMIKILTDAGAVKNVDAGVIYQNDRYDFRRGSDPYLKHIPALSGRGEKIGAYAIAFLRDGGFQFEILGREDIEKVRAASESYKNEEGRKYSPWETWEDEMWKKTVLKRLFKLLPKTNFSDQLIAAISHDYEAEMSDVSAPKEDKYSGIFEDIQEATVVNDPPAPKTKTAKQPDGQPEIFNDPQK